MTASSVEEVGVGGGRLRTEPPLDCAVPWLLRPVPVPPGLSDPDSLCEALRQNWSTDILRRIEVLGEAAFLAATPEALAAFASAFARCLSAAQRRCDLASHWRASSI